MPVAWQNAPGSAPPPGAQTLTGISPDPRGSPETWGRNLPPGVVGDSGDPWNYEPAPAAKGTKMSFWDSLIDGAQDLIDTGAGVYKDYVDLEKGQEEADAVRNLALINSAQASNRGPATSAYSPMAGIPSWMLYAAAALVAIIVLRKF